MGPGVALADHADLSSLVPCCTILPAEVSVQDIVIRTECCAEIK